MMNLQGRVVAITGAGRGIGLATAKALIAQGAKVCIGDIDLEVAKQAAAQIGAVACHVDVRDRASVQAFVDAAEAQLGTLDVMINNAGIMPMGYFLDEDPALADTQIDINFRGVIHGMQAALPRMLARGRGHIINTASLAGRFALPGAAIYSGTKFAVVGMTEAVAGEYRDSGVHFTAIMPSKVLTELTSGTDQASRGLPAVTTEQVAAAIVGALHKPRLFVAVPEYLNWVQAAYNAAPNPLQTGIRRLVGDNRILTQLDHGAHAGYDSRIKGLMTR